MPFRFFPLEIYDSETPLFCIKFLGKSSLLQHLLHFHVYHCLLILVPMFRFWRKHFLHLLNTRHFGLLLIFSMQGDKNEHESKPPCLIMLDLEMRISCGKNLFLSKKRYLPFSMKPLWYCLCPHPPFSGANSPFERVVCRSVYLIC